MFTAVKLNFLKILFFVLLSVKSFSQEKVIGIVDEPGNVLGDAYTKIEVMLNLHEDNFRQVYVTAPVTATAGN